MYRVGSLLLIHGKITTLPANHGTLGRPDGLSKATLSQNGSRPDRVHFSGFMASVRRFPAYMLSQRLMVVFPVRSGRWKEHLLVR
jgi:hypothetical protein